MKPFTIIGAAMLLLVAHTSNAQFLNKLKKKAEAAVSKAVSGSSSSSPDNSTESTEDNASDGGAAQGSTPSAPVATSPIAKYGKQLFTMQQGEYLVYGELSLAMKADGAHVKAVTKKDRQFYLYDNGERQGPFTTPPVHLLDDWKREYGYEKNPAEEYMSNGMSYLSAGNLVVDGKKHGPALVVNAMYHNPKNKRFYALVTRTENDKIGYYLVSNNGARKLPGIGTGLIVSPTGESGGVTIFATQYNAKTEDDAFKYVVADDTYIIMADGKTGGPYKYVDGTRNSLDNSGNYVQIGKSGPKEGIFVNGKPVITFADGLYGTGVPFVNAAGTSAAWFERGTLQFSDGTLIKGNAIQPALSAENGVTYINWVSITKGNVYHCKKEL